MISLFKRRVIGNVKVSVLGFGMPMFGGSLFVFSYSYIGHLRSVLLGLICRKAKNVRKKGVG